MLRNASRGLKFGRVLLYSMFENRVLAEDNIYEPRREEVTGG
jgi:hypothetical protein